MPRNSIEILKHKNNVLGEHKVPNKMTWRALIQSLYHEINLGIVNSNDRGVFYKGFLASSEITLKSRVGIALKCRPHDFQISLLSPTDQSSPFS